MKKITKNNSEEKTYHKCILAVEIEDSLTYQL